MDTKTATTDFWDYAASCRSQIEAALEENLPLAPGPIGLRFNEAVRCAVFPGGKRLRPVLTMLGAELFGLPGSEVLNAAVGVEYVHTSSLIFDDLPAMDNAGERRGKPPLHKQFGEDIATLVAITLLNASYRMVTLDGEGDHQTSVTAVWEIVDCVGPAGMVGGQALDLTGGCATGRSYSPRTVSSVKNLKTSALVRLALRLGAMYAGADEDALAALTRFAECFGNAYQLSDDLTDIEEDAAAPHHHEPPSHATLLAAVADARSTLRANFPDSPARRRLLELVDYIAGS